MSSDLLGGAPYGFPHGKGDSNNIDMTMEHLAVRHPSPCNDDDDDIIGHLLQSPTNSTISLSFDPATITNDQKMQQRVQSPPKDTDSNWTTNTTFNTNETTDITENTGDNDDDLLQVMQLTWNALNAVSSDDGVKRKSLVGTTHQDGNGRVTTTKQQYIPTQHQNAPISLLPELPTSPPATTTVRIYIADFKNYKTVQLTNLLTTAMVIQYLKRKELLDNDDDWTLFEIEAEHGIERPLRLWEIVSNVTSCWEKRTTNTLLIKKYGLYKTLTLDAIRGRPSLVHGWLNIEFKNERWQKRYCFIKDHIIYHADNSKYNNPAALCPLTSFDVYTLLQPCSTSPTPFVFALKVQDKMHTYGKEQGYVRLFTAENQSCLETWVLGIRQEKSILHYRKNPKRVKNPLAVFKPSTSSLNHDNKTQPQRHKSNILETSTEKIDDTCAEEPKPVEPHRITDEAIKRRVSRRGVSRSGTTRHRQHRTSTCDTNDTKSTTTPADEDSNSNTLIQLDDKFKFSKGSLLDKNNIIMGSSPAHPQHDTRPNLNRMTSTKISHSGDSQQQSRITGSLSIRRKGHDSQQHQQQQQHQNQDVPQHSNTELTNGTSSGKTVSISSLTPGTTLLNLDHTPERFHTQSLLQRQLKPLLNFNQGVTPIPRR